MFILMRAHEYSIVTTGLSRKYNKVFYSRQDAKEYMYKLLGKLDLHIEKIYDDKHDKTYCCNNDVRFYIQRTR